MAMNRLTVLHLFLLVALAPAIVSEADDASAPRAPREAAATLRLADPRLMIELVASEPDVVSPVAIAWDEDGRMFVAEMIDYPAGPKAGRIKRLEDRDGDGRYERVTVFADGLPYPTSVLPWNGGVLVTAAPDIWFFKDRDGDGRADERKVILTGFGEGNQQLRVNGLSWGLDNWVYGANGRSDGEIRRPGDPPAKSISIRRRDFRFRPATGEVEAIAGSSQFGLAHDDWGHRFTSWNTIPMRHVVIEDDVLARNPYLAETSTVAAILDTVDGGRIYSISPTQPRFNRESVAFFNASCGTTVYRGDLLGDSYEGNAFVCEPLTNIVHRRILVPAGPTFSARRVEQGKEFLASIDPSFRPVNLATGPDGAPYVVDFYRELVEHPDFVPPDIRKTIDFRRWHDRGRIWRIRPRLLENHGVPEQPRLGHTATAKLVSILGHANGWWRDTAQRMLIERQDRAALTPLRDMLVHAESALARLHALAALHGLNALEPSNLRTALHDRSAGVREHALRLAARAPGLSEEIARLAEDPDVRVRLQAAIALGNRPAPFALKALVRIAARDAGDEWMRLAVLSGLGETAWPFLKELLQAQPRLADQPAPGEAVLLTGAAAIIGVRHRADEIHDVLTLVAHVQAGQTARPPWALLSGLAEGLARAGQPLRDLTKNPPAAFKDSVASLVRVLPEARRTVQSKEQPTETRVLALRVLVDCRPAESAGLLAELLGKDEPAELQSAAARALSAARQPDAVSRILPRWGALPTTTRREILAAITSDRVLAGPLVHALEDGTIAAAELDAVSREALHRLNDAALRTRVDAILAKAAPSDRRDVLENYQPALKRDGDPARGKTLFARTCQSCHQKRGQGNMVGPDLSGVAGRPASVLLNDVLDPSREVAPDYVGFVLVTKDGRVISGLLVEETATTIKLRRDQGVEEVVLRSQVEELRSTGRSLMPDGLEQTLSVQDLADLIAFLRRP